MRGKLLTVWWPQNKGRHYVHWICNGIVLRLLRGSCLQFVCTCQSDQGASPAPHTHTHTHTRELELWISLGLFHFLCSVSDWLLLSCHRPSLDTERLSVRSGSSCNYFKVSSVYLCWRPLYEASLIKPSEVNPLFPNLWEAFDSPSLLSPLLSVEPWAMVPHRNQEKNNVKCQCAIFIHLFHYMCTMPRFGDVMESNWTRRGSRGNATQIYNFNQGTGDMKKRNSVLCDYLEVPCSILWGQF